MWKNSTSGRFLTSLRLFASSSPEKTDRDVTISAGVNMLRESSGLKRKRCFIEEDPFGEMYPPCPLLHVPPGEGVIGDLNSSAAIPRPLLKCPSPEPLPMPLQSLVSEPALTRVTKLAEGGHEGARQLATYWVGQGVGIKRRQIVGHGVIRSWRRSRRD